MRPLLTCLILTLSAATINPINLTAQQSDQVIIEHYSRAAEEALSRNDTDAARLALEKLSRLTPDDPQVFANLGAVAYTLGRYPQATEAYKKALQLDPAAPQVPLMLGMCYMELGQVTDAIPMLETGFQHPPSDEVGRSVGLNLLSAYVKVNQNRKALDVTGKLLERYPNDPEVLYRASHLYGDMALKTMVHLEGIAPNSVWKQMSFAEALESEKRYDLAIIQYKKVIAADAEMPEAYYRLGRALLLQSPDGAEARTEALNQFQRALALDPGNSAAEYEMGEIYRRQGQFESARDHFARAVTLDPTEENAQIALARTLIRLQQAKESVPHLLSAIELNSNNEVSHFLLANAYKSLGNSKGYETEMELFNKYHRLHDQAQAQAGGQKLQELSTPAQTRQTIDSAPSPQP